MLGLLEISPSNQLQLSSRYLKQKIKFSPRQAEDIELIFPQIFFPKIRSLHPLGHFQNYGFLMPKQCKKLIKAPWHLGEILNRYKQINEVPHNHSDFGSS